jgi:hypothetical protein
MRRCPALAVLLLGAGAAACAPPEKGAGVNASGVFTRAAWHLMVECEGQELAHKTTYVYPGNTEASTYAIEDHDGDLVVRYGDVEIGTGHRDHDGIVVDLVALDDDPDATVAWRLRATVETDLPFNGKVIVGSLDPAVAPLEGGEPGACSFGSRNTVWWAEEPDPDALTRDAIAGDEPAAVLGTYDLFAWWVRLGTVSPDPLKGVDRATIAGDLISLAISPDPSIDSHTGGGVLVRDGVTTPGVGVADETGLWFEQADFSLVNVSVSHAVIHNENRSEGQSEAVQRVMVGWVDGSLYIEPDFYPPGITGPSGWLKIERPGLAFWEDVDYGPAGEPGAPPPFAPRKSLIAGELEGRHVLVDGVPR